MLMDVLSHKTYFSILLLSREKGDSLTGSTDTDVDTDKMAISREIGHGHGHARHNN